MSAGGVAPRGAGFEGVMLTGGNQYIGDKGGSAGGRGGEVLRGAGGRGVRGIYRYRKLRQKG